MNITSAMVLAKGCRVFPQKAKQKVAQRRYPEAEVERHKQSRYHKEKESVVREQLLSVCTKHYSCPAGGAGTPSGNNPRICSLRKPQAECEDFPIPVKSVI
mmetsp:Transcript_3361/g.9642  ORF Transcript_3361/g.9642 Transcript_3361/m.9642 type:complete len:101 (+) Transcript_3361:455-757(+)